MGRLEIIMAFERLLQECEFWAKMGVNINGSLRDDARKALEALNAKASE